MENLTKLFRRTDGTEVQFIRASTLSHYWFCAVQAWLQASGIDTPSNEALSIGKAIHDEITASRKSSVWEDEFSTFIQQFLVTRETGVGSTGLRGTEDRVFQRAWPDGKTVIGHITTHGIDDFEVNPNREVIFVEYKTTAQRVIDYYKLMPAIFQLKVYVWILEPYLQIGGYKFSRGKIVFLNRKGEPLGEKLVEDYTASAVESDIARILAQFRDPTTLIPPAKFKCLYCNEIFKSKCPFQQGAKT